MKKPTSNPGSNLVAEITNAEMEKKIGENFTAYVNELSEKPDTKVSPAFFQVFSDLQQNNDKVGSEIFYSFLNKVFDKSPDEIDSILPQYLADLWTSKHLGRPGF